MSIGLFTKSAVKLSYNLDWDTIKPIAEKLVDIPQQHHLEENGVTSFENYEYPTHKLEELTEYYDYLKPHLEKYIFEDLKYPKEYDIEIQNAWFSRYNENGYVRQHSHTDSVAVACLYIELPENGGNIEFKNPYYSHRKNYIRTNDNWLWEEVEVKETDVLIFDSAIWHRSQPNLSNKERWTLTTNIGLVKKDNIL